MKFLSVDVKDKCVCLLCRNTLLVFKRGTLERYYQSKNIDFNSFKFQPNSKIQPKNNETKSSLFLKIKIIWIKM